MSDPRLHDVPMNAMPQTLRQQLGFDLGRPSSQDHRPRRPCSRERAAWWFQQMRQAIGDAQPCTTSHVDRNGGPGANRAATPIHGRRGPSETPHVAAGTFSSALR
jgi:hypothetical protein